ncbi:threonine aldolase family protein [Pokkaliibacter sp. CJK22405]|uniref:threonine aldolase family protein n=1 Tax=Pokkaliibacter sp. CJK22405 TaxID=3384615 RepID=UPI003984755E
MSSSLRPAFHSDNVAGASMEVLNAIVESSAGSAVPYGNDPLTERVEQQLAEIFECELSAFLVPTGTAANCLALSTLTPPWGAILCHPESHINNDENTAPEFFTGGARLIEVSGDNGKLNPSRLVEQLSHKKGDVHSAQPLAVSITQVTETGSVYRLEEIQTIGALCKEAQVPLHMDGARFANALAALGCTPAEMTWKAGVTALSFGATKNGVLGAEAVIMFDKKYAQEMGFRRKRSGHLFSKMRLLSAQMNAYLSNGLWMRNATHANAMAARLAKGLSGLPGVEAVGRSDANILFFRFPRTLIQNLQSEGYGFYTGRWEPGVVRMVTSFATTEADVDAFIEGASKALR